MGMGIGIGWDGKEDGCMGMRMWMGRRKEDEYVHVPNYYLFILLLLPL